MTDVMQGANVIGQGFTQGLQNVAALGQIETNEMKQALMIDEAQKAKEKYEDEMKVIPIQEFGSMVQPEFLEPLYKMADSMGIVRKRGNEKFIRKGEAKQFMQEIGKNEILKEALVDGGLKSIDLNLNLTKQELDKVRGVYESYDRTHKQNIRNIELKAEELSAKKGFQHVPDADAINKENARHAEAMKQPEMQKYVELTSKSRTLHDRKMQLISNSEKRYDVYKELSKKYGPENATDIMTGSKTEEYVKREHEEITQRTKAREDWEERKRLTELMRYQRETDVAAIRKSGAGKPTVSDKNEARVKQDTTTFIARIERERGTPFNRDEREAITPVIENLYRKKETSDKKIRFFAKQALARVPAGRSSGTGQTTEQPKKEKTLF